MPLKYNQGLPPRSSRFLPPGSDYADQFNDSSCLRTGNAPTKKERWQSQLTSYKRPETECGLSSNSVTWAGAFSTSVKPQPESLPHHSCHFYKDRFHILDGQDKEMGKFGHDILSGYENPQILRQTKLTAGLREDNEDVGTFSRRRGKVLREYPLCLTSTRLAEPFPKPIESGRITAARHDGGVITDTLANRPISRQRRDLSLQLNDSSRSPTCDSPASKYSAFGRNTFNERPTTSTTLGFSPASRMPGSPVAVRTRDLYPWDWTRKEKDSFGRGLLSPSAYH